MINRKGNGKLVLVGLLLLSLVVGGLLFAFREDLFSKEDVVEEIPLGQILLTARNSSGIINARYVAGWYTYDNRTYEYSPFTVVSEGFTQEEKVVDGQLVSAGKIFNFPLDKSMVIYASAPGHYNWSKRVAYGIPKDSVLKEVISLFPFPSITMKNMSSFVEGKGIYAVNISTVGKAFQPSVCLSHSYGFVGVNIGNGDEISSPVRLVPFVDKCFGQVLVLENNNHVLNIEYELKENKECADYVEVWVVDKDLIQRKEPQMAVFETESGKNIGGPDIAQRFYIC